MRKTSRLKTFTSLIAGLVLGLWQKARLKLDSNIRSPVNRWLERDARSMVPRFAIEALCAA